MNHVRVIVTKDPEQMGVCAADVFEAAINAKPACVIGLATGSTPLPLYRELIKREKEGKAKHTINAIANRTNRSSSSNMDEDSNVCVYSTTTIML